MSRFHVWGCGLSGHETTQGVFDTLVKAVQCAVRCSHTCSSDTQEIFSSRHNAIVFVALRVEPSEGEGAPVNYVCTPVQAVKEIILYNKEKEAGAELAAREQ